MDPYLEDPTLWPDVHHRLIGISSEVLLQQLRPRYFVQIDERLYVANENEETRGMIIPDLRVRELVSYGAQRAGATTIAEPGIELHFDLDIREGRLEILDRDLQRVVTVVEFVSPRQQSPRIERA